MKKKPEVDPITIPNNENEESNYLFISGVIKTRSKKSLLALVR